MKFLLVVAATLAVAAGTVAPGLRAKVLTGEVQDVILDLPQVANQLESNLAFQALKGDARAEAVHTILKGLTDAAQASYVSVIKSLGLEVEQYWASNIVLIKSINAEQLDVLATMQGEFTLREQFTASVNAAVVEHNTNITQNPQWGVAMIRAPAAWAVTQGEGCVAIIVDTGVHPGHVALTGYAGAWQDTYYNEPNPTDVHGHGTHCAGSILGKTNGVGVAPGAQWIACRGLNHQGSGTETALTGCSQFAVSGANPRPHVSSNSWGGGSGQSWYDAQITAMRSAGIIPVFAIGNAGSACRTANSPGDRPNNIAVGATTNTDTMASFSSRGPNSVGELKPDVSAPGANIVSCGTGTNNYVTMSGTSMATPHVAGAVCLALGANPAWGFDEIYVALSGTGAMPTLSAADRNCGLPLPGSDFPNHAWGYGRIDIGAAIGV